MTHHMHRIVLISSIAVMQGCASVPKEIVSDPSTPRLELNVSLDPGAVLNKLRTVRVACGGDRTEEAADATGTTLVAWVAHKVSYVMRVEAGAPGTRVTIYMNMNEQTQRSNWPRVFDNWFVKNNDRCIADIRRD